MRFIWLAAAVTLACSSNDEAAGSGGGGGSAGNPAWLAEADVLVSGHDVNNQDCRTAICRHNENTDLVRHDGVIYLVHRTAVSQVLGPNSSLFVYTSKDDGKTFQNVAVIPAPIDRDIRDPHFYEVGGELWIKALARLPVVSKRDSDVDTVALLSRSSDGKTWTSWEEMGPHTWSYWRIREHDGAYYTAAYEDGDKSVVLFSSQDGKAWTQGPVIYDVSTDTPLETELTFMPSGKLLALVRMDGTDDELLGDTGRLRTKICWADPPYSSFSCPDEFSGERLDGPVSFFVGSRLFLIARRHLQGLGKKRTALYEITGNFDGGPLTLQTLGDFPSAGDTAYAGAVELADGRWLATYYSGDLEKDEGWIFGILDLTDIWRALIDPKKL
jgi:hypothetical protein